MAFLDELLKILRLAMEFVSIRAYALDLISGQYISTKNYGVKMPMSLSQRGDYFQILDKGPFKY